MAGSERDILADLGRFVAGVGLVLVAAGVEIASRRRGPRADRQGGAGSLEDLLRSRPRGRRKPPEAGLAVPAVPPRGPLPLKGGAAAPLEFGG